MCLKLLLILCLPRIQYNPTGLESSSLSYLQFSLFFFLCSFNHLPPSALFCFQPPQPHSLASLTSLLPLFLRHLLYHQTEVIRSTSWISMARFSIYFFCLPISLPSTPLISGDQERIYWDHFSTKGIAPEVLIDHLVVCTLSHAELKSHKHPFHSFKLQSFTGAHSLCRRPDTVNNSQQFRPSFLPA